MTSFGNKYDILSFKSIQKLVLTISEESRYHNKTICMFAYQSSAKI